MSRNLVSVILLTWGILLERKFEEENLRMMKWLNNYNNWLYLNIRGFLGHKILEVGAGFGALTSYLISKTRVVISIDKNASNNDRGLKIERFDIEKDDVKKMFGEFDTIVCINVLEHIKNQKKAISNMYKCLKKGGNLILIVPAIKWLYGTIDKADNHYRRYGKVEIKTLVEGCGFDIKQIKYMNFLGILGWIYHNKIRKLNIHDESDLIRFDSFVPLISVIEKLFPPPLGLILIIVGVK